MPAELEAAVKSTENERPAGVDNLPAGLLQAGGEKLVDSRVANLLHGPTRWSSHFERNSKATSSATQAVIQKATLNRLKPKADNIVTEE